MVKEEGIIEYLLDRESDSMGTSLPMCIYNDNMNQYFTLITVDFLEEDHMGILFRNSKGISWGYIIYEYDEYLLGDKKAAEIKSTLERICKEKCGPYRSLRKSFDVLIAIMKF